MIFCFMYDDIYHENYIELDYKTTIDFNYIS